MALKRENGEVMKPWDQRSPAEEQEVEESRPYRIAQEEAAYDTLVTLHRYLMPEYYGEKPPKGTKKALFAQLEHVAFVVNEAVYYHPEAQFPEG